MDRLPPKCRQAFALVEFDGRPIPEVAAHMGVKANTVYQLLKRAYVHLGKTSLTGAGKRQKRHDGPATHW